MTTQEKIIKYLSSRKTPATQAEIAKGAKVNANSLRRILGGLAWRRDRDRYGDRIWRNVDKHISLIRTMTPRGYGYSLLTRQKAGAV